MLYWTEPLLGEVRRMKFDGLEVMEVILDTGLQVCVATLYDPLLVLTLSS